MDESFGATVEPECHLAVLNLNATWRLKTGSYRSFYWSTCRLRPRGVRIKLPILETLDLIFLTLVRKSFLDLKILGSLQPSHWRPMFSRDNDWDHQVRSPSSQGPHWKSEAKRYHSVYTLQDRKKPQKILNDIFNSYSVSWNGSDGCLIILLGKNEENNGISFIFGFYQID